MSDARQKAVERLAVMLMNGMPQTLIDGDPAEDDLQRVFMDSQAATWKRNDGYALERWNANMVSAQRVLSLLGLVAIEPALVDDAETAVDCLDDALQSGVENWTEVRKAVGCLRAVLAQLRGGR